MHQDRYFTNLWRKCFNTSFQDSLYNFGAKLLIPLSSHFKRAKTGLRSPFYLNCSHILFLKIIQTSLNHSIIKAFQMLISINIFTHFIFARHTNRACALHSKNELWFKHFYLLGVTHKQTDRQTDRRTLPSALSPLLHGQLQSKPYKNLLSSYFLMNQS